MPKSPPPGGSFRIARIAGIDVHVHWLWLVVGWFEIRGGGRYGSVAWNLLEYLSIFGIVLLHEFGHALACRQVGGRSDTILLWPLGGIAYVRPPARPGATLWTIAAGPLVNVALVLPLGLPLALHQFGAMPLSGDVWNYFYFTSLINAGLLVFNMLPIYPLDGGQILQAVLWFLVGRTRSLRIAGGIGLAGSLGLLALVLPTGEILLIVMAGYLALRAWGGLKFAESLERRLAAPRHEGVACPACGLPPLTGALWTCGRCGQRFDTFEHAAVCPGCAYEYPDTSCPECLEHHPWTEWRRAAPPRV